jgi:hypothetical protein
MLEQHSHRDPPEKLVHIIVEEILPVSGDQEGIGIERHPTGFDETQNTHRGDRLGDAGHTHQRTRRHRRP